MESKLSTCPEVVELLSLLGQNGLYKQRDDVKHLVSYIEDMENKITDMAIELTEMHKEVEKIHDSTLKAKCTRLYNSAEEKLTQAKTAVKRVKDNFIRSAASAVKAFKENGRVALVQAVSAMKIPEAVGLLKNGMSKSAAAMRESAGKLDLIREELHEVGHHLKNAGRTLFGKPTRDAKELEADKGVLAKLRKFMERAAGRFEEMEKGADSLISKMQTAREKADNHKSVKKELKALKASGKAVKSHSPIEPVR